MAKPEKIPNTPAVIELRKNNINFVPLFYRYVDHGGTKESSKQLDIDEHRIIKTLIFEDSDAKPFIVLMNGNYEVSEKRLARILGCKFVRLCSAAKAQKHSGYLIGGTSPFGTKKRMRIFAQKDIFNFDRIVINGGKRGFLVEIRTEDLKSTLNPEIIDAAINKS